MLRVVEKIRCAIADTLIEVQGTAVPVTASVGGAHGRAVLRRAHQRSRRRALQRQTARPQPLDRVRVSTPQGPRHGLRVRQRTAFH
ncbi:MAG: hypothetical protein CPDRYMAC_1236 [uncultured Paraburkholderia sp.]|nr:MAG: hypothetical protein CPDRYDRY_1215 [uncultured Paraburkholderia sp.]CAH2916806.1 MAG: hypothetical protein CPDRYMAC_1236 [uncultured Paraburkholderia sp.]